MLIVVAKRASILFTKKSQNQFKFLKIMIEELKIQLEFGAGAETLFDNIRKRTVLLDGTQTRTIRDLLKWICENILTGDKNLFVQGETVRPGILCLINDTDWELMGELEYVLKPNDDILFISTLHGG